MNKRWIVWGLAGLLVISVAVYAAAGAGVLAPRNEPVVDGMPVPGSENVPETIVGSEMPVPGSEETVETIVGSQMPVPGLDDIEEMIVTNE